MSQLRFDLQRADQTAILKAARHRGNGKVSARMLKSVLDQIDDYAREDGECFASQETLAQAIGCHPDTVKHTIALLLDRSLITSELRRNRYGIVTNHYRIVWNELALLATPASGHQPSFKGKSGHQLSAALKKAMGHSKQPKGQLDEPMGQSIEPIGQLMGAMGQSIGPIGRSAPQTVEPKEPPPTAAIPTQVAAEAFDHDWNAARAALRDCGLGATNRAIGLARQHKVTPEQVVAICSEYRKHAGKLKSPGSILYRLAEGDWPIAHSETCQLSLTEKRQDTKPRSWIGAGSITSPMTDEEKRLFEQFGIKW